MRAREAEARGRRAAAAVTALPRCQPPLYCTVSFYNRAFLYVNFIYSFIGLHCPCIHGLLPQLEPKRICGSLQSVSFFITIITHAYSGGLILIKTSSMV